jgi:HEAT repeat protein
MRFDERAAKKLGEAYCDPAETVRVRSDAAEALGHLLAYSKQARRFTPLLLRGLDDPAPEIRFWSCFALAKLDDESALPALRGLVDDTAVAPGWGEVGDEAKWAIAQIEGDTDFEARWMKARANYRR